MAFQPLRRSVPHIAKSIASAASTPSIPDFARRGLCTCVPLSTRKRWSPLPRRIPTSLNELPAEFQIRDAVPTEPTAGEVDRISVQLEINRVDLQLEKLARHRKLYIDLDEVQALWQQTSGLQEIRKLASFYKIDRDMFSSKGVSVSSWMDVCYSSNGDGPSKSVHRGNFVKPSNALEAPEVTINGDQDKLHSLILVNLDGHPANKDKEILHWATCNISGNQIQNGDTVVPYLPPMPWRGTGFHRLVFALFEQTGEIDASQLKQFAGDGGSLLSRSFSTRFFVSNNEGFQLTSLAWFQAEWDSSVSETCSQLQDLPAGEPLFEWEQYSEPKQLKQSLKAELRELQGRNM